MNKREEAAAQLLRAKGIRATPQRIALLARLRTQRAPQSADAIVRALRGVLDQATVYRGLQEFEKARIVRRVQLRGSSLYEAPGSHHHHLICRSCGAVEDVEVNLPKSVSEKVLAKSKRFISIEDESLEFFGICKLCSAHS